MKPQVLTIGHSNLPLDQFLGLLARHQVEALVDIRRFPSSRNFPHFNQKSLAAALPNAGIEYHWMEAPAAVGRSSVMNPPPTKVSRTRGSAIISITC